MRWSTFCQHLSTFFTRFHLLAIAFLVFIALILIVVGGFTTAWCLRYGETFECHSLFLSERAFSCLFKLIPTGIIVLLIISLITFTVLIIGEYHFQYYWIVKKEYQLVARWINIISLSLSIILITLILLKWFHIPSHTDSKMNLKLVPFINTNTTSANAVKIRYISISRDDPQFLKAIGAHRRPASSYRQSMNHGPNLFFSAFTILLIALISFIVGHRSRM